MIDLNGMPRLLEPLAEKRTPIVLASDANYVVYMSIALKSVLVNANPDRQYEVVILDGGIPQYDRAVISHMVKPHANVTLRFADMRPIEEFYQGLYTRAYLTSAAYLRVFLPFVMPDYAQALYLDCDVIMLGDVAELLDLDMSDHYLGASIDGSQLFDLAQSKAGELDETWLEYKTDRLGFTGDKFLRYFNSGVLLMNLEKMREARRSCMIS